MLKVLVTQLCPTLCDLMDYTVHGILQARILEGVAISFSAQETNIKGLPSHKKSTQGTVHDFRVPSKPRTLHI